MLSASRLTLSASRALLGIVTALYLAQLGLPATAIGVLFLAAAGVTAVLTTLIGMLSDRVGRRPFLIVTPLLATAASAVFPFTRSFWVLLVAAAIGSIGRGGGAGGGMTGPHRPAESALLVEVVPARRRNDAFARLALFSALGAVAGSVLATLARTVPGAHPAATVVMHEYRPAFLVAAGLAAVSGLMCVAVEEPARAAPAPGRPGFRWPRRSWPLLWRMWITNSINGLGIGMFGPFVSYWFFRRFGLGAGTIGPMFAAISALTVIVIPLSAPAARRFGTVRSVVAALVVQGLLLVPMAFAPTAAIAAGLYALRMIVQRVGMPLRQAFVVALADPDERASVSAIASLPMQATSTAAPVLAGYLFAEVSLAAPFSIGGVLQASTALLWARFFGRARMPEEAVPPVRRPAGPAPRPAGGEVAARSVDPLDR